MRMRAPGVRQFEKCADIAVCSCEPIIATPPTAMPGMPPDWTVFIICTQLPSASTIEISQLPTGAFDFALFQPEAAMAAAPLVRRTWLVRSTFGRLARISFASAA